MVQVDFSIQGIILNKDIEKTANRTKTKTTIKRGRKVNLVVPSNRGGGSEVASKGVGICSFLHNA